MCALTGKASVSMFEEPLPQLAGVEVRTSQQREHSTSRNKCAAKPVQQCGKCWQLCLLEKSSLPSQHVSPDKLP
jgi:hypothetical protein